MPEVNQNYVGGKWKSSSSGETYEQKNPADLTETTGIWQKSTVEDARAAISAAQGASALWSSMNVYKRAEYLKKALALLNSRTEEIANVLTAENGKTLKESKTEILSAIKEMDFQISEGVRLSGQIMPSEQEGVLAYTIRRPLGVVAIIAPWNFPFNVPCRKVIPALMAGNTCVLKPSNLTPGVGAEFTKLFAQTDLPAGVLNFITGSGAVLGDEFVTNPVVKAISFTGSTAVGTEINKKAATNLARTQLEMGGKNPLVVLSDANLAQAADAASLAAYACAGQWCTSTSRVIVEKKVLKDFLDLLLERIGKFVVGRGTDPRTTMGPVCGQDQLRNILACIERGKTEGAKILTGGNRISRGDLAKGCFIEPTIFINVRTDMFIAQEEIFGPVLSVMAAEDFEQAIEMANAIKFGLSSSIYTNDLQKALTFVEKTDVGMTHVNMHTALKEPPFSFGGVKMSGCGIPEAGHTGIEFFTEHKVVYIKYR
jgi:aldehyde dehydrogenase (NAD+)